MKTMSVTRWNGNEDRTRSSWSREWTPGRLETRNIRRRKNLKSYEYPKNNIDHDMSYEGKYDLTGNPKSKATTPKRDGTE